MKNALIILFTLTAYFAKADTISTCRVYYNDKLLKQLVVDASVKVIKIDSKAYKTGDYLGIQYSDDMPCPECQYEILISTKTDMEVFFIREKDKYKLMKIDLKHIIPDFETDQLDEVVVDLLEIDKMGSRKTIARLFEIKIN